MRREFAIDKGQFEQLEAGEIIKLEDTGTITTTLALIGAGQTEGRTETTDHEEETAAARRTNHEEERRQPKTSENEEAEAKALTRAKFAILEKLRTEGDPARVIRWAEAYSQILAAEKEPPAGHCITGGKLPRIPWETVTALY